MRSTGLPRRRAGRTSYQLQPETIHVNHSGILPAAALSNFFKAPSTSIVNTSKLPSINARDDLPAVNTKSVHQKNKCLAEVIQSQLMELKLQHRCRYQRRELGNLPRSSMKKSHATDSNGNIPTKLNSGVCSPNRKSCSNLSKELSSESKPSPSSAWHPKQKISHTKSFEVSSNNKIALHMPKVTNVALRERHDNFQKQFYTPANAEPISSGRVLELTRSNTLIITDTDDQNKSSLSSSYMDQDKFESVFNWVQSVEMAHKLEGKCSEVLSVPTLL